MARKLRFEYPGAVYHVLNRGDRREAIVRDDQDREALLATLGEACLKAGWHVHLRTVCEYVHLNPVRANLRRSEEPVRAYRKESLAQVEERRGVSLTARNCGKAPWRRRSG